MLTSSPLLAQEERPGPIVVTGDQVEYFEDGKRVEAAGRVVVTYKDMRLTCDKATVYLDTKDATAEGNVVLYREDVIYRGDRADYNFETKQGEVLNARIEVGPWHGGGKEVTKTTEKEYVARPGYVSTCEYDPPHYRIQARKVKIYPGDKVVAQHSVIYIWKIPVFYMPYYVHSLKESSPHVSVTPGQNKEWGFYALTKYRFRFSDDLKANFHLDWREKRGTAPGLDLIYNTNKFGSGILRTYFLEDQDKHHLEAARDRRTRYRVQLRHRWDVDAKTVATLEYHKSSDKDFIKDFFYREEYEKEPQPESFLSVIRSERHYTVSLLAKKRFNRFETVVERLPELMLESRNIRLAKTPFYYKGEATFSNLTKRYADSPVDDDAVRFHTDNKLSYVQKFFGWLEVTPFAGTQQTYYSKDILNEEDLIRGIFYTGIDLSTKFYRLFDVTTDKFLGMEINKLRHIITPSVRYLYSREPTVPPTKLFQFDSTDDLTKKNRVTLALQNDLQTKWKSGDTLETRDLATLLVSTDYVFRERGRGKFTNIDFDLETRPYRWLTVESDASFNPRTRDFENWNVDLIAKGKPVEDEKVEVGGEQYGREKWRFDLGYRYAQESNAQLTTQTTYRLTKKWLLRSYHRYEFEKNEFREREYAAIRDLHCWETEFGVNFDGPYNKMFFVVFRLKAFPDLTLKLRKTYPSVRTHFFRGTKEISK